MAEDNFTVRWSKEMADWWVSPPMQVCTFPYIEVQILSNKGETKDFAPLVMVGNTNGEIWVVVSCHSGQMGL